MDENKKKFDELTDEMKTAILAAVSKVSGTENVNAALLLGAISVTAAAFASSIAVQLGEPPINGIIKLINLLSNSLNKMVEDDEESNKN